MGDWNPGWKRDWKRDRDDGRDTINVVNIDRNTARIWQPSARIQRQNWQRQRFYNNDNAPARGGNARARRGDADDAGRRFASIARPSRQDFDERNDDGDRRAWRREDSDDQSNATARRQSLSVRERTGQGDNVQARKWRAGASSVRANRSSDDDQPRRKFKKERSESVHSENRASNVNRHLRAARIEGARGGSREAAESYSRPNKRHQEGAGGKKGEGGGHKSGKGKKDGGKSEKKDKD